MSSQPETHQQLGLKAQESEKLSATQTDQSVKPTQTMTSIPYETFIKDIDGDKQTNTRSANSSANSSPINTPKRSKIASALIMEKIKELTGNTNSHTMESTDIDNEPVTNPEVMDVRTVVRMLVVLTPRKPGNNCVIVQLSQVF